MKTICVNISNYSGGQEIIYIGRPSKWGNPFKIRRDGNRKECLDKYYEYLKNTRQDLIDSLPELEGMALGCWCKPKDCHGDILVKLLEDDPWELWKKE